MRFTLLFFGIFAVVIYFWINRARKSPVPISRVGIEVAYQRSQSGQFTFLKTGRLLFVTTLTSEEGPDDERLEVRCRIPVTFELDGDESGFQQQFDVGMKKIEQRLKSLMPTDTSKEAEEYYVSSVISLKGGAGTDKFAGRLEDFQSRYTVQFHEVSGTKSAFFVSETGVAFSAMFESELTPEMGLRMTLNTEARNKNEAICRQILKRGFKVEDPEAGKLDRSGGNRP